MELLHRVGALRLGQLSHHEPGEVRVGKEQLRLRGQQGTEPGEWGTAEGCGSGTMPE